MKLYDDLGVERDATPDEIKAAHRKQVKVHHPDAGGDRDKFDAIQRAFDVLGDEGRRARYDETGDEGGSKMADDAKLRELLYSLIDAMIEGEVDLDTTNVVDYVQAHLKAIEIEIRKTIAKGETKLKRVEKLAKRLKKKAEKSASPLAHIMFRTIDQKKEAVGKPLQESRDDLERHLKLVEIFASFDYEVEFDRWAQASARPYDPYDRPPTPYERLGILYDDQGRPLS